MYYLRSSKKEPSSCAPPALNLASLLVSHIQELKSLKPILKLLYSLLCSSVSYEVCQGTRDNTAGDLFKLEDMVTISALLFKELQKRLVSCSDDASLDQDVGLAEAHVYKKDSGEELLLLLRCCFLLVRLNPYDQILNEQFQIVVALLHKLSFQGTSCRQKRGSIRFSDPISSQSTYNSCSNPPSPNDCAKLSDLSQRCILRMLEVYLDEVFADRPFRERIAVFDSVSSTYHSQSSCSSIKIEVVHENIAAHFLLSISEKYILQSFTKSLIWTEKTILSSPELSLHVAISLINHPVVMSAPTLLLAHLISLVSEVIGIYIFPEGEFPNDLLVLISSLRSMIKLTASSLIWIMHGEHRGAACLTRQCLA